jgi:Glycosyltransferase family 87
VSFFDGPRLIAEAALTPRGRVERFIDYRQLRYPYGAPLAHAPWLLALGCLAFLLATAVLPLRRLRNLDVLALLALVAPVLLLDARYAAASTLAAVPSLAWLAGRCAWWAFAERDAPEPARPLLDALTPAWEDGRRVRMLRLAVGVAAACTAMIAISAPSVVDVGQALMEGGTLLLHGVLPYGHMPGDVFHGDVYPLPGYVVYMPLALVNPVHDDWDVANGALVVAALSALAAAWMLARLARRAALPASLTGEAERAAGLRAALAWLTFPPLLLTVSSGTSDVLLAALLLGALVLAHRRLAAASVVILAGWFKLVPFALLPVWLAPLRGRRLAAALGVLVGTTAATLIALVALGGIGAPGRMLHAMAYQLTRQSLHSPWTLLGIEWLQPLAQAGVLALIAGATVRARRDPAFAVDPVRLAALTGAVMLGLQLSGNYWTYLYLAWALPGVLLSLFAETPQTLSEPAEAPVARRLAEPAPALV